MNRMQPLGVTRIVANLSTQVLHMRIDGALVSFEVVAEHLFHKLHTRIDASWITAKRGEQLEFARCEIDDLIVHQDLMTRDIDRKFTELKHFTLRLSLRMHAAQECARARNKLTRTEGLYQIVIGTKFETDDAILHFTFCREHDDGRIGIIANNAANALARNARKHEV